ncbi:hypothetical protein LOTGIDRAFT_164302 [Lottia gigantea]|uniref:Methyltransferase FkbM domain-containing protein n=1 Tax=Lottia gigantea TaxID=225164 RepID=V4A5X4_LOTGI|nr:hypothetical protein LOTGIDRAFT_164302 [Lottia gigantea]ESO90375.1 hypothetical protein LOTGIDRAFT_164302 [Lottia gigantea]
MECGTSIVRKELNDLKAVLNQNVKSSTTRTDKNRGGKSHFSLVQTPSEFDKNMIQTVLLDDLLPFVTFKKAFMKIDVEFHENCVLKGGEQFFKSVEIPYVFMEWSLRQPDTGGQILDFMKRHKYTPRQPMFQGDKTRLFNFQSGLFWTHMDLKGQISTIMEKERFLYFGYASNLLKERLLVDKPGAYKKFICVGKLKSLFWKEMSDDSLRSSLMIRNDKSEANSDFVRDENVVAEIGSENKSDATQNCPKHKASKTTNNKIMEKERFLYFGYASCNCCQTTSYVPLMHKLKVI